MRFLLTMTLLLGLANSAWAGLDEVRALAEQGDSAAQYDLGHLYYMGNAVPQDYAEAVKWFRRAAEQGNATAQYRLSWLYAGGQGIGHNYVQAHMWSNLAASQGHVSAMEMRDFLDSKMSPSQIAEAHRLARALARVAAAARGAWPPPPSGRAPTGSWRPPASRRRRVGRPG